MSAAAVRSACSARTQVSRPTYGIERSQASSRLRQIKVHSTSLEVDGNQPTQPQAWLEMMNTLKASNVTLINPHEVKISQEKGVSVLDVRTSKQYAEGFIEDSVNVPLYQPIQGWEPYKIARRAGYLAFGVMEGTEPNPDFMEEVMEAVEDKEAGVVVCCQMGGTLEPTKSNSNLGIQSRSLVAAYQLVKAGYSGVRVLKNGMAGWIEDGNDLYQFDE